jgi:hypothetical protein
MIMYKIKHIWLIETNYEMISHKKVYFRYSRIIYINTLIYYNR